MVGAIDVVKVGKVFSAVEALREVNLSIRPGEFVSFVGPSGCGKSTLLKLIGGLIEPSTGSIAVDGKAITRPRRDIGIMFQTPVLFPWRTVLENVLLPIEVFGLDPRAAADKARGILKLVGLEGRESAYPRELSGGMQQRTALSRVLLTDPPIILMDEPFGALDEFTRERMNLELLRIWQERRQTIVFVTHSIAEAVFLSDRIVVMGTAPGRVLSVIDVKLPRPRTIEVLKTPQFGSTAFEVRELLGVAHY
ncbi:MAG TPA: ABC transporter ATP-binding protein [Burkholderiales bacterium]|nr:ABC transporter ATP-binding protein [Burkholderiales bacterium]